MVRGLGEVSAVWRFLDGPHVGGVDVLRICEHPSLLYETGEDEAGHHVVVAASMTPALSLIGFKTSCRTAGQANARRNAIGDRHLEHVVHAVIAFSIRKLV